MGTFKVDLGINNGNGGATQWVQAQVDTGASYTALPSGLLYGQVGIEPQQERMFTLADGIKQLFAMGEARFYVGDREGTSPVVFGAEDTYLIGATTLQVLGLIADTTNHRLIPAPELTL